MNETNLGAGGVEQTSLPYKDRSTSLMIFGILTIVLGALTGLLFLLMVCGQMIIRNTGAPEGPIWPVVLAALMYLAAAVALVWLGIGSIQARRWARALLLIMSWSWLVLGLFTLVSMAFLMPKILAGAPVAANTNQALPGSAEVVVMAVMIGVLSVIFIIMPIIWIVFYQSRHVMATCEARDPVTRWTDACPLPVLALCLWLAFSVLALLAMPLTGHAVMPFFGTLLTGLSGALLCLLLAPIWICAIWLLYKLDARGWWLVLIAMVLMSISTVVTDTRHTLTEMYQLMGYSPDQVKQFGSIGMPMATMSLIFTVPIIGYIIFLKKYMRAKA